MAHNFADLFEHAVDAVPDRVALIVGDRQVTYRELDDRANRLAHHLVDAGLGEGSHIGIHMHNAIETIETIFAAFKMRAVPITVNYRYTSDELAYLYDNADLEALVYHRSYAPVVGQVLPSVSKLRYSLVVDEPGEQETAATEGTSVRYDDALATGSAERDFGERSGDDKYILYTGGTTGRPKGVVWRQEDIWRVLAGGTDFYSGEPAPDEYHQSRIGAAAAEPMRWLLLPPLIHTSALMPTCNALFSGNTVILDAHFDPHGTWQIVQRHRPQIIVITGDAMGRPLVDALISGSYDPSGLAVVASGAALFSQSVKDAVFDAIPGVLVSDSVGSSETGFSGIGLASQGLVQKGGPRIGAGRGTFVLDDEDRPVTAGEGWLAKKGHVPFGYYNDPVRSAEIFRTVDGERVVVTGDRARVEDDGTITLLGRGNMVVNTGGEKVFAEEVEAVVKAHPEVFDAIVIGVPDERWGQRVAAVIRPREAGRLNVGDLEQHTRGALAGYKIPRSIWLSDTIERTPSGKPDYRWAHEFASKTIAHYTI
ncbi:MAG: acyl-CoA synthetase [Rhodococcus sp. (in: high G+C Gram-positive bacteria)]|uniref:acyl-CoA synthetase n=1 Tax=Rhodococcus sp. TaxID=1831 RepID=UPI003BB4EF59